MFPESQRVRTSFSLGLVGDHTHCPPVHSAEPHDNVASIVRHDLKEVPFVHHARDDVQHVIGLVRRVRDNVLQACHQTVSEWGVGGGEY